MTRRTFYAVLVLLVLVPAVIRPTSVSAALTTQRVASGLNLPVYVTAPPGDDRLFIVEQCGVIRILDNGVLLPDPFLNINALIPNIAGQDERGLLGLAFHPRYAINGYFYVHYNNLASDTVIKRYRVSADPNIADPADSMTVLVVDQPFNNHNGGQIAFGPNDCYLYIGLGDGGSGGDPFENGQSDNTLLGKILRIDVDGGVPYAIPPDNPHVGPGPPLDEIWAKGVRNPYRWSFDRLTGDLYMGEVGQNCYEEIDFQPASSPGGENYGWDVMEGNHCFNEANFNDCFFVGCVQTGVPAIHEYTHGGNPFRCSVTGGYVYRGSAIPNLPGTYFFADFCSNQIWSFRYVGGQVTEFTERTAELAPGGGLSIGNVGGFGEDGFGELYIVDRGTPAGSPCTLGGATGEVYKILSTGPPRTSPLEPVAAFGGCAVGGVNDHAGAPQIGFSVLPANPNPFSYMTGFGVELERPGRLTIQIFDTGGRLTRTLDSAVRPSGLHFFSWNGANDRGVASPSGVYFMRAEVNGQAITQRLIRVR
jgi:glucose/arabinose dehydrogenase